MKTSKIDSLPLKTLQWKKLVPWIGRAREAVARLDEETKQLTLDCFEPLLRKEALNNGRKSGKKAELNLEAFHAAAKLSRPLTIASICKIHAIVKRDGPNPASIGKIRTTQNWIGPEGKGMVKAYFFPPPPSKVKSHLRALETYISKDDLDPLVQLAIWFAQFLAIHPFMDGNGRVARILTPFFAVQKQMIRLPILFLSPYIERTRIQYMNRLFQITDDNQWEDWILYFLQGIVKSASETTRYLLTRSVNR